MKTKGNPRPKASPKTPAGQSDAQNATRIESILKTILSPRLKPLDSPRTALMEARNDLQDNMQATQIDPCLVLTPKTKDIMQYVEQRMAGYDEIQNTLNPLLHTSQSATSTFDGMLLQDILQDENNMYITSSRIHEALYPGNENQTPSPSDLAHNTSHPRYAIEFPALGTGRTNQDTMDDPSFQYNESNIDKPDEFPNQVCCDPWATHIFNEMNLQHVGTGHPADVTETHQNIEGQDCCNEEGVEVDDITEEDIEIFLENEMMAEKGWRTDK